MTYYLFLNIILPIPTVDVAFIELLVVFNTLYVHDYVYIMVFSEVLT